MKEIISKQIKLSISENLFMLRIPQKLMNESGLKPGDVMRLKVKNDEFILVKSDNNIGTRIAHRNYIKFPAAFVRKYRPNDCEYIMMWLDQHNRINFKFARGQMMEVG
jgi:antitoxin component of MazEF toxin-antitoxin module